MAASQIIDIDTFCCKTELVQKFSLKALSVWIWESANCISFWKEMLLKVSPCSANKANWNWWLEIHDRGENFGQLKFAADRCPEEEER